ncbi:preprotein translocase subunit SecG [Methylocystis sp. Sn-Cys]|uniref:preprotein translocase subunit SecG n=1 Tax=Methylocystis sp. Sn-Cys TaxID=1701263 RepID=UPI0019242A29|nr:preprotein translocase subunit SecG [Methylocystis sp. Sn-Cys]MBL1256000.1 preprotein translocase subunit SecG [Methylocystis sp. Sn-Cys]
MQQVIIAIHLMVVTALVILVLYQKSEGGALGMGGSGVFTGRGQANALTRATGILATIFFLTSIALTVLPAWERRAAGGDDWTKAIDQGDIQLKEVKPGEKAPEAGKDSVFEQLQRAQQKRQQSTPVAPAEEKPALRPSQEPPKAEAPKSEPVTEAPKAEAPKSEAPAAEAPKAPEATKSEAPAAPAEAPKAEAPKPETEAPKAETPADKPAAPTQWKSPTQ